MKPIKDLDEIAQLLGVYLSEIDVDGSMPVDLTRQNLQAILDWHNQQTLELLDTLSRQIGNLQTYRLTEASIDILVEKADVVEVIETERIKLKEAEL